MSDGPVLATIGYERATMEDFLHRLTTAGVEIVLDVRAVAASRRAGFSKRVLAASLAEAGIDYLHLRGLGTPKAGREAARKGRVQEMREIYEIQLESIEAQADLDNAMEIVGRRRAALLCFEADASGCHRSIIAERLIERLGAKIVNL